VDLILSQPKALSFRSGSGGGAPLPFGGIGVGSGVGSGPVLFALGSPQVPGLDLEPCTSTRTQVCYIFQTVTRNSPLFLSSPLLSKAYMQLSPVPLSLGH
jgi:hypothetical protein